MGRFFLKSFFGSPSVAFIRNHPSGIHSPGSRELESLLTNQRRAYMFITCSIWGITALTQTEQSMKTPFSSSLRGMMASDYLPTLETLPSIANRFGVGYYSWNLPENLADLSEFRRLSMLEANPPVILRKEDKTSSSHLYCEQRNEAGRA